MDSWEPDDNIKEFFSVLREIYPNKMPKEVLDYINTFLDNRDSEQPEFFLNFWEFLPKRIQTGRKYLLNEASEESRSED